MVKRINKKKTMKGGLDFSTTPSSLHLSDLEVSNPDQVVEETIEVEDQLTTPESFPSSSTPISLITQADDINNTDSFPISSSLNSGKTDKELSTEVILGGKSRKRNGKKRIIKKRSGKKTKRNVKSKRNGKKSKKNGKKTRKNKRYNGGSNINETTSFNTNVDEKERKEYEEFETLGFKK